ncbi:MAG: toxin-antitoxin system YwqK family antitoxin [Candidatus Binataceae bacterium]
MTDAVRMRKPALAALALTAALVATGLGACRRSGAPTFSCPPGAKLMGARPPKGEELWCQKIVDGKPVKDGLFIVYGDGSDPMIKGQYHDGRQDGQWTIFYENGRRQSLDHYKDGMQDGAHISWYANGAKAIEGNYKNGKREGVWTQWDPTGLTSHKQVYKDGAKVP